MSSKPDAQRRSRTSKQKVKERYPQAKAVHDGRRSGWAIYSSNHPSDFICLSQGWTTAANAWQRAWEVINQQDEKK